MCNKIKNWDKTSLEVKKHINGTTKGHYTNGIETIDYILSHKLDFPLGSAVKYITRYPITKNRKDLLKAMHFLQIKLSEK